jgi:hypothetical protein
MDLSFPFGTPLPRIVERESFEAVMRTGQPAIGPVVLGPISRRVAFPIRVPIVRNGRIVYVLTGSRQFYDSTRSVAARTRGAEQFVGRSVSPEFERAPGQVPNAEGARRSLGRRT